MEVIGVAARGAKNNIESALFGFIPLESLNTFTIRKDFVFYKKLHDLLGGCLLKALPKRSGDGVFTEIHHQRIERVTARLQE
jgi:hypothetical protein